MRSTRIETIGKRFGQWVVIEAVEKDSSRCVKYLCQCDCGGRRIVSGKRLRNGKSYRCQSCAVSKGKIQVDVTGMKFGRWTALGLSRSNSRRMWICRCECGAIHELLLSQLRCISIGGCSACKHKRQCKIASSRLWHYVRANARLRGIEFKLGRDYLFGLLHDQQNRCALTGMEISIAITARRHQHGGTTASIDRIDSSKGYVEGNVQWVHKDVNRMKWVFSQNRFIEICIKVAELHKDKDQCA